jgi:hypothetical protein
MMSGRVAFAAAALGGAEAADVAGVGVLSDSATDTDLPSVTDDFEEDEDGDEDEDEGDEDAPDDWISAYCALRENRFYAKVCGQAAAHELAPFPDAARPQVALDYVQDSFNLVGLQASVPDYDNALRLLCDDDTGACACVRARANGGLLNAGVDGRRAIPAERRGLFARACGRQAAVRPRAPALHRHSRWPRADGMSAGPGVPAS